MRVSVQSNLKTDTKTAWDLLKKTSTLIYVAEGVMTYDGAASLPPEWRVGTRVNLKPRLWGKPQGDHIVRVVDVDERDMQIETEEHGGFVTKWRHVMHLIENYPGECQLVDTIDIKAGWRTPFVCLFAFYFYRHRHKRWQTLISRPTVQPV